MVSLLRTMRSFGQMNWQAVLSSALHPSHFSGFTKLGICFLLGASRDRCVSWRESHQQGLAFIVRSCDHLPFLGFSKAARSSLPLSTSSKSCAILSSAL